ncbi:hypothetical protein [Saccharopolyspora aridisoli]|nr:hypothetical protein [Saccharopolyspora aridisoli]
MTLEVRNATTVRTTEPAVAVDGEVRALVPPAVAHPGDPAAVKKFDEAALEERHSDMILIMSILFQWLRSRPGSDAQPQQEQLWAIPVPSDIRQAVRKLMLTGDQVRAVSTLREAIPALSLVQAKLLTDRLAEQDDHPTSYAEVVRELRTRDPELDAQLWSLVEKKAETEIVRLLRERLGVDLRVANEIAEFMQESV